MEYMRQDDVVDIRVNANDLAAVIAEGESARRRLREGELAWVKADEQWEEEVAELRSELGSFRRAVQEALGFDQPGLLPDDDLVARVRDAVLVRNRKAPEWTAPADLSRNDAIDQLIEPVMSEIHAYDERMQAAGIEARPTRRRDGTMSGEPRVVPMGQPFAGFPDETAFPEAGDGPADHQYDAITYAKMVERERAGRNDGPATETMAPVDAYGVDDQVLTDLLGLVCVTVPPEQLAMWSPEQREQVAQWAGATHLSASDNDDVVVPPRPDFLPGGDRGE